MTLIEICPNCGMKRDPEERFCWWCSEDMTKYDDECYECGAPKGLAKRVTEWIRAELREP